MKTSSLILIAAILISGGIGFMLGRSTAPKQNTAIAANSAVVVNKPSEEKEKPSETAKPEPKPAVEKPIVVPVSKPAPIPEPKPEPKPIKTTTNKKVLDRSIKGISDIKISTVLGTISTNLEAKRLSYDSKQLQDCSGIYHQLKDSIQSRIPVLAGAEYIYPPVTSVRSSRQIADWYHTNNNLTIIENPVASRNSIRPGTVMFYGRPNKKYSNMTIEMLTDKSNNYTRNGAIMHIAVVTEVQTDENGDVINYTIMHGRNSRVHASRSGSKEVQSRNTKGLPAFGNWTQQWLAIANIATKK